MKRKQEQKIMIDSILGSVFFEFVGASTKWSVYAVLHKLRGKEVISFKEMWEGRNGSQKSEIVMHGFSIPTGACL